MEWKYEMIHYILIDNMKIRIIQKFLKRIILQKIKIDFLTKYFVLLYNHQRFKLGAYLGFFSVVPKLAIKTIKTSIPYMSILSFLQKFNVKINSEE